MNDSKIWKYIQRVQYELKEGSLDTQDTTISALHDYLIESGCEFFPSFIYPLLKDVFLFYCQKILPYVGMSSEDQNFVRKEFEQTISHLQEQEQTAKELETRVKHLFFQLILAFS